LLNDFVLWSFLRSLHNWWYHRRNGKDIRQKNGISKERRICKVFDGAFKLSRYVSKTNNELHGKGRREFSSSERLRRIVDVGQSVFMLRIT